MTTITEQIETALYLQAAATTPFTADASAFNAEHDALRQDAAAAEASIAALTALIYAHCSRQAAGVNWTDRLELKEL